MSDAEIFAYVAEKDGRFIGVIAPELAGEKTGREWFSDMAKSSAIIKTMASREEYNAWLKTVTIRKPQP